MLPDPRDQPFMRVPDVADVLAISESSAYEAIHAGQIPAIRVGRRFRVPTAAVWRLADMTLENVEAGEDQSPATDTPGAGGPRYDHNLHAV